MFPINDAFDAVLVGGFLFGLIFTIASLLLGFADTSVHSDADAPHHGDVAHDTDGAPWHAVFNVSSFLAFITWFSGITYIARNGFDFTLWLAIPIGIVFALMAALLIGWMLFKVLPEHSLELDPRDWETPGVIGRVSSTIRPGGIGEIVYEQNGSLHSASARSIADGNIPRDTEIVIIRNERGVAIVQPFEELLREHEERQIAASAPVETTTTSGSPS